MCCSLGKYVLPSAKICVAVCEKYVLQCMKTDIYKGYRQVIAVYENVVAVCRNVVAVCRNVVAVCDNRYVQGLWTSCRSLWRRCCSLWNVVAVCECIFKDNPFREITCARIFACTKMYLCAQYTRIFQPPPLSAPPPPLQSIRMTNTSLEPIIFSLFGSENHTWSLITKETAPDYYKISRRVSRINSP